MVNFLDSIINVLPEYQQVAISSLIARKKKTGEILSIRNQQSEVLRIYNEIRSKLGNILLTPRLAVSGTKISSVDHNYNMESIHIDLNALYSNIDQIGKAFLIQSVALESGYLKSKAAIQKLINDARIFGLRKKYLDFNDIKVIDFNSSRNTSDVTPKAHVDPKTRLLQLRAVTSTRAQLLNRENKITKIYTKTISPGIKSTLSKSFPPENMVDQKPETFWTTLVMADYPVTQKYVTATRSGTQSQIDVKGPVVEVFFKFSHMERINHVRLLPFADFPISILDVSYRPSPDSAVFVTISDFSRSTTLDWEEYNFGSIFTNEIRIVIAQENTKLIAYQVPEGVARNTDIFQRIYDGKIAKIIGNDMLDSDSVLEFSRSKSLYDDAIQSLQNSLLANGDSYNYKTKLDYYYNFNKIISDILAPINPEITTESIFGGSSEEELTSERLIIVKKFEYILGIREVELGYAVYSPVGNYASEKLDIQATISEIQVEVDERHTSFETNWETDYRKTSTEWSIDLGEGRVVPVHPRNLVDRDSGLPLAKDEVIFFDNTVGQAVTRLGARFSSVHALKKDGQLIPEEEYDSIRISGSIPALQITMSGSEWYDPNSVYTVDYFVDRASYSIEVLGKYKSRELVTPEVFGATGPNNDITLSKYPYIDYTVVNLPQFFSATGQGEWSYNPPQSNIFSGQVKLLPTILDGLGNVLQSGLPSFQTISGLWGERSGELHLAMSGNPDLNTIYFGVVSGNSFGYYLQLMNQKNIYEIDNFVVENTGTLLAPISVTVSQLRDWTAINPLAFSGDLTGSQTTGYLQVNYAIGVGLKSDDQVFALGNSSYSPIEVTVDGRKAKNITNYYTLQHPAFGVSTLLGVDFEYIQAGKKLYFNQPTTQEIKVDYNWLTDYVRLQGVLKSNSPVNPEVTPKVNEVRLLINTSII